MSRARSSRVGRYLPSGRVRVVEYPDPYPVRTSKVVKVEELNGRAQGA